MGGGVFGGGDWVGRGGGGGESGGGGAGGGGLVTRGGGADGLGGGGEGLGGDHKKDVGGGGEGLGGDHKKDVGGGGEGLGGDQYVFCMVTKVGAITRSMPSALDADAWDANLAWSPVVTVCACALLLTAIVSVITVLTELYVTLSGVTPAASATAVVIVEPSVKLTGELEIIDMVTV